MPTTPHNYIAVPSTLTSDGREDEEDDAVDVGVDVVGQEGGLHEVGHQCDVCSGVEKPCGELHTGSSKGAPHRPLLPDPVRSAGLGANRKLDTARVQWVCSDTLRSDNDK